MKTPLRKILDKLCDELGYNEGNLPTRGWCPECEHSVTINVSCEVHHSELQKELILDAAENIIQNLYKSDITSASCTVSTFTQTK